MSAGETVVTYWPIIVFAVAAVAAGVGIYVRLQRQLGVLQDRSDHPREDGEDDDLVAELRRQTRRADQRIEDLERDLKREREARQEDTARHTRDLNDMRQQITNLSVQLTSATGQLDYYRQLLAEREDKA